MSDEMETTKKGDKRVNVEYKGGSSNSVYGLGMIGAWVYYIGRADTNEERLKGFLKGLVWPAILVLKALEMLDKE